MAQVLRRLDNLAAASHPSLMIGIGDGGDDAGVYRVTDDLALVQTVDFFTPIVDEAGDWGRIAAANALSDVYAMGGTPLTALQVVGWPRDELPFDLLGDVLEGAAEVLAAAGCTLVGGHSIDDPEPKYGLAVTGVVHPDRVIAARGASPGDALVLTKPIGTGIIATGIKRGATGQAVRDEAVRVMVSLNAAASQAMIAVGVSAATDVTGFGLLGHLAEMLDGDVGAEVDTAEVPILEGAVELAERGMVSGGTRRNLEHAAATTDFGTASEIRRILLADAQTSGGLLIAVPTERVGSLVAELDARGVETAAVVGRITEGAGRIRLVGA